MSLNIFVISAAGIENKTLELDDKVSFAINSKLDLLRFIFAGTGVNDLELFEVKRLSKRHKNYVPLNTKNDFREFKRSLKVKNRAKIIVFTDRGHRDQVDGLDGLKLLNILLESLEKGFEKHMCSEIDRHQVGRQNGDLMSSSLVKHTHKHVFCDACDCLGPEFISGVRYKCIICHDYDLCSSCFSSGQASGSHEKSHPMVAIDSPTDLDKWGLLPTFETVHSFSKSMIDLQNLPQKIHNEPPFRSENDFTYTHEHQVERSCHTRMMARNPGIVINDFEDVEQVKNPFSLELSFKPIGRSLAYAVIKNMSKRNFDINGFRFDVKCGDKAKSTTLIERNQVMKPGRSIKLNVRINSSQFEYPIRISLQKGLIFGRGQISLESESEILLLTKIDSNTPAHTTPSCFELKQATEPVHTLILPNPNKEMSALEFSNTAREPTSEDDYDLVSMPDVDELLSDFEIVSRVNSIKM